MTVGDMLAQLIDLMPVIAAATRKRHYSDDRRQSIVTDGDGRALGVASLVETPRIAEG
jgi:hypothetical protein